MESGADDVALERQWTLPATPRSVPKLRHEVVAQARSWNLPEPVSADLVLITNELATNAVIHAGGGGLLVTLRIGPRHVYVSVMDRAPAQQPSWQPQSPASESGRGLALIDTVATAWGSEALSGGAKLVWATLASHPEQGAPVAPGTRADAPS